LYLKSLEAIGIDLREHDIKFEEDNWESPTLGAWGIGWQVMLDGLEITQFTYFQQCGGVDLDPISVELTYGMERIGAFLQDVDSIYDIVWARDPQDPSKVFTYGDVRMADELQMSVYNFERADVAKTWQHFSLYEAECIGLLDVIEAELTSLESGGGAVTFSTLDRLDKGGEELAISGMRGPILGAFELCLKCSHLFNILDARGAISVTERVGVIGRIRQLAVRVAKVWVRQQRGIKGSAPDPEKVAQDA
jgi:glycyl-tRNA synthetase alpha chain